MTLIDVVADMVGEPVALNAQGDFVVLSSKSPVSASVVTDAESFFIDAEISEALRETKADAQAYLAETDWIVSKISEAMLKGEDIAPLLTLYSSEFLEREASRLTINL